MPASLINQCVALLDNCSADIATLASPLASKADYQNPNIVKVIIDMDSNALYFSRSSIPYSRREKTNKLAVQTTIINKFENGQLNHDPKLVGKIKR